MIRCCQLSTVFSSICSETKVSKQRKFENFRHLRHIIVKCYGTSISSGGVSGSFPDTPACGNPASSAPSRKYSRPVIDNDRSFGQLGTIIRDVCPLRRLDEQLYWT
ncbi:hypothetical protein APICC_03760 [Apis cerana cerana]|uniref:Uncharacterized protein n=1 Tax=Apis cerana cerana TaxID=94128 RepID=A0A2A3EPZ1_APICC|nr:hypothetical protein APICC_03760 [Apis cerana cerana]